MCNFWNLDYQRILCDQKYSKDENLSATTPNNNFSAYGSSYSPRSVTPITSMAASAAAAVAATTAAYPHMVINREMT